MTKKKVLVIGEYILDIFTYCSATGKTAPDRPVPVINKVYTTETPGGAANFSENLRSLFPNLDVYHIHQEQIIKKQRFLDIVSNQHFVRVDEFDEVEEKLDLEKLETVLTRNNLMLIDFELIAISDYGKGFIDEKLMKELTKHSTVFADTKHELNEDWSKDIFCVKINDKEWRAHKNVTDAAALCKNLIVTRGEVGAEYNSKVYSGRKVKGGDVSGCGDVFFAGIVGLHLEGLSFEQSIPICNMLCSLAVKEQGVNIMKKEDLNIAISLLDCPL